jgi:hypothetical protein
VDVQIDDDEEPYGNARAIDSDDDRPVAALSEEDMELIRLFFLIVIHLCRRKRWRAARGS